MHIFTSHYCYGDHKKWSKISFVRKRKIQPERFKLCSAQYDIYGQSPRQQRSLVSDVGCPARWVRLPKKCDLILFQKEKLKRNMQSKGHTKTSELPYWAAQIYFFLISHYEIYKISSHFFGVKYSPCGWGWRWCPGNTHVC